MTSASTQARTPGGYKYFSSAVPADGSVATNVPGTLQFPGSEGLREVAQLQLVAATNGAANIAAPSNGRFRAVRFANGATATDGTNSWLLKGINKSASDAVVFSHGFGTGTNAALGTANDAVTAAYEGGEILSAESTIYVNEGDNVYVAWTKDGSPGALTAAILFEPSVKGR